MTPPFSAWLQRFFTERLTQQRQASPHAIAAYRGAFRLLLHFAADRLHRAPSALTMDDLSPAFIGEFLDHLDRDRHNGTAATPAPRLSAAKVLRVTTALWLAVQLGEGILSEDQIADMLDRGYALMRRYLKPPPRARSCPRAVRQPISGWPRLLTRAETAGPVKVTLV